MHGLDAKEHKMCKTFFEGVTLNEQVTMNEIKETTFLSETPLSLRIASNSAKLHCAVLMTCVRFC